MGKIKIKGEEYLLKNTLRALFIYEEINDKPFTPDKSRNIYTYIYSVLLANNPDSYISFGDFIDAIDEDPQLNADILKWMSEEGKKKELIVKDEKKADVKKKGLQQKKSIES